MTVVHSKFSNVALLAVAGACFATTVAIVYILKRALREELIEEVPSVQSSRYTVVEVPVPLDIVGAVIGRHGANIELIQKATSTKINFKDEVKDEGSRIALIRGKPDNVHEAEKLLRATVIARANVISEEMWVSGKACGAIIGKNGSNIRLINETSKAKVKVDSNSVRGQLQRITIRGTSSEITLAKMMIEDKITEVQEKELKNTHLTVDGRLLLCDSPAKSKRKSAPAVEDLIPTGQDGFLEIFVSSLASPDSFWVQPVGINFSTELDKLIEKMTEAYESSNNSEENVLTEVKEGNIVATRFPHDNKWYRATVRSVIVDDYDPGNSDVELFYADFGDIGTIKLRDLKSLEQEFLSLPFQAVECKLEGISPKGNSWSTESVEYFERITHCTLWNSLMMRVMGEIKKPENEEMAIKIVEIVDTNNESDVSLSETMIKQGFAISNKSSDY